MKKWVFSIGSSITASDSVGNMATTTFTDSVTALAITSPTTSSPVSVLPGGTVDVTYQITVSNTTEVVDVQVQIPGAASTVNVPLFTPSTLTFTKTTVMTISTTTVPGTYNVIVSARQPNTGGSTYWSKGVKNTDAVIVLPPAPTDTTPSVTAPANQPADAGVSKSFDLGLFSDPDGSPWNVTVEWGDGSSDTFQQSTAGSLGQLTHTYADNVTYTVTVTVTDSTSRSGSGTFQVNVSDVTPPGTSIISGPPEWIGTTSATFVWTGLDNITEIGDLVYSYKLDDGDWSVYSSGTSVTLSVSSGLHSFQVRAKDEAQNVDPSPALQGFGVDTTPPVIEYTVNPAPTGAGWNNSTPVTVTWSVTDLESGIASSSGSDPTTLTDETAGITLTCSATNEAGLSNSVSVTIKIDKTPPVITAGEPTGTPGNDDWWVSDVTVPFSATDNLSGFAPAGALDTPMTSKPTSGEGLALTVTSDGISDRAGNAALVIQAGPFKVDKTAPEITINAPVEGALYLLNEEVFADWSATDPVSGVASDSATLNGTTIAKGGLLTGSVGAKTFIVTATNGAGLTAPKTVSYKVQYDFGGFLPPVSLDGRSLFKLGSTIPVKFQLFDAAGNPVSTAVATIKVAKMSGATAGTEVEAVSTSAATSGNVFRYDSTGQLYIFNLSTKSLPAPAGGTVVGTWRINVYLDDGTTQTVDIGIKK
jgi:hypothetical protein